MRSMRRRRRAPCRGPFQCAFGGLHGEGRALPFQVQHDAHHAQRPVALTCQQPLGKPGATGLAGLALHCPRANGRCSRSDSASAESPSNAAWSRSSVHRLSSMACSNLPRSSGVMPSASGNGARAASRNSACARNAQSRCSASRRSPPASGASQAVASMDGNCWSRSGEALPVMSAIAAIASSASHSEALPPGNADGRWWSRLPSPHS